MKQARRLQRLGPRGDRKSTRLNSSHPKIYPLSLHDALPICPSHDSGSARPHLTAGPGLRMDHETSTATPAAWPARALQSYWRWSSLQLGRGTEKTIASTIAML